MKKAILTINCSETAIKFSLFQSGTPLTSVFYGAIESRGDRRKQLYFTESGTRHKKRIDIPGEDEDNAVNFLMNWLEMQEVFKSVSATGHRVGAGENHKTPTLVTPALLHELKKSCTVNSGYLHAEIALIEIFAARYPSIIQIACFETPLPCYISQLGSNAAYPSNNSFLQCYGFHGLSFEFLMEELHRSAGRQAAQGRVILMHLGNRKSLAAFKNGKSIDEDIDFTLSADLTVDDRAQTPPLIRYQYKNDGSWWFSTQPATMTLTSAKTAGIPLPPHFQKPIASNEEDIEGFCYETRKWVGSLAAALGGVDSLVFTGGFGEHAPDVRSEVCDSLAFLGIELDEIKNMNNENLISSDISSVMVRIVQTNEELLIARMVAAILEY